MNRFITQLDKTRRQKLLRQLRGEKIFFRKSTSSFLGILKPAISSWLVIFLLLQMIAGVLFFPSIQEAQADPGWLTGWSYRKQITIDETKVDDDLTDFPVLVGLASSTNFDFTKASSTGADIRFTSSDEATRLKYEGERHDQKGFFLLAYHRSKSLILYISLC